MNSSVSQLFDKLKCNEESLQNEAVAQLAMVFEHSFYPAREDAVWQAILPEDLYKVCLSPREISEVLGEAISVVESELLCRSSKLSLIGVIARNSSDEEAEVLLKFFLEFAEEFSEQEAFSFLADFTRFLLRVQKIASIRTLLVKYNTLHLLEELQAKGSPRLIDSASRLLDQIN